MHPIWGKRDQWLRRDVIMGMRGRGDFFPVHPVSRDISIQTDRNASFRMPSGSQPTSPHPLLPLFEPGMSSHLQRLPGLQCEKLPIWQIPTSVEDNGPPTPCPCVSNRARLADKTTCWSKLLTAGARSAVG